MPDAGPPIPCTYFGHGELAVCVAVVQPALVVTSPAMLSSLTAPCDVATQDPCVFAYRSITISSLLRLEAPKAIVLVGVDSITIDANGYVDAASHLGGPFGAGSTSGMPCTIPNGAYDISGGGGAAGGTSGQAGAPGGAGDGGAAAGGVPSVAYMPYPSSGGCDGGNGGQSTATSDSPGGHGGGAVNLISNGAISIAGIVNASGAGAPAAGNFDGGGGGGAGGYIGIDGDPTQYSFTGTVFSLGGGGSSGSSAGAGSNPGGDAVPPAVPGDSATPGIGGFSPTGSGIGAGGRGGAGASAPVAGGAASAGAGGGGGGGGYGYIAIVGSSVQPAAFDPPPVEP